MSQGVRIEVPIQAAETPMRALTLCMIVKDEAELLPRCLASVEGIADEIVIVDTGSTDATRDIARAHGARVIDHPFADDFAAARNAGLAAVTTPWVLVLDADEWLPESSRAPLVHALSAPSAQQAAGFFLNFDNDLGGGRSHVCALLRVFRADPALRFRYRIHEQIIPDLIDFARARRLGIPVLENVVVRHDGYLPERCRSKGKDQRNARLFDQQVRDTPDDPYAWYKYADFLRVPREGVRAPFSAKVALERAEAILERMDPAIVKLMSFPPEVAALLALEYDRDGDFERALEIARSGLKRHGPTANLLYVTGRLEQKLGRSRDALRTFARLRALDGELSAVPPEPGVTGPSAFVGMALALFDMGRKRAAARCLDHAVALDASHLDARLARARVSLDHGRVADAIADYRAARDGHPRDASVRLRLGTVLVAVGESEAAEAEFRAAIERGADESTVLPLIAEAQVSRRDLEAAYRTLLAAPEAPDAAIGLAVLRDLARGKDPFASVSAGGSQAARWKRALQRAGIRATATSV